MWDSLAIEVGHRRGEESKDWRIAGRPVNAEQLGDRVADEIRNEMILPEVKTKQLYFYIHTNRF